MTVNESEKNREERFLAERYNGSAEANELRCQYLKKIRHAYEQFDFSELFDDLDEECQWGGTTGKQAVIEMLKEAAGSMKETNCLHRCTLVQVGSAYSPLEGRTAAGSRAFVGLLYEDGEICMVDQTPRQTLFCRMTVAPNGKIRAYYATLPAGAYHAIP